MTYCHGRFFTRLRIAPPFRFDDFLIFAATVEVPKSNWSYGPWLTHVLGALYRHFYPLLPSLEAYPGYRQRSPCSRQPPYATSAQRRPAGSQEIGLYREPPLFYNDRVNYYPFLRPFLTCTCLPNSLCAELTSSPKPRLW
jgi:hypothetical protein